MATYSTNELALCSGVAMLSEGVRAACEFLGQGHRVVCHVEREIAAAAQLVTLMESGIIDPAPIWDDLLTFDGLPWRGKVDCITGGFPCQPWSAAGKQEGTADERWIWPDIARIIREIEPSLCFFENVRGLVSGGGLEFVLADLARLGFDAEWCVVSGADVGASHERERVFILAYRNDIGSQWRRRSRNGRAGPAHDGEQVDDAMRAERGAGAGRGVRYLERQDAEGQENSGVGSAGEILADASGARLPVAEQPGQPGQAQCGQRAGAAVAELRGAQLFAPGPDSDEWPGIIADRPYLAPATEPGVRVLADGLAVVLDESRSDQLRAVGNGVIPLAAAAAFVVLARRAGII